MAVAVEQQVQLLKRAVLALRTRVDQSPKDVASACALAEALFRLAARTADPARRVEHLARASQLDPYDARLRIALGRACMHAGDMRGAGEAFGAAAALRPRDPAPWLAMGTALVAHYRAVPEAKAKVIDRAIESYDKALALDPSLDAVHCAKLHAAACARVAGRPIKLLPAAQRAMTPAPPFAPAVSWIAASLAYAIHYPKHLGTRNPKDRITPDERKAKAQAYRALVSWIKPWIAAVPAIASLAMVEAMVEILDAELPDAGDATAAAKGQAFANLFAAAAPRFTDRWLLHLILHQKLEEIADPAIRVDVVRAVIKHMPLAVGLDRELFAALNAAARAALLDSRVADAQRYWRDGLEIDRYCVAFHHNLALVALHQRDAAHLALHLQAAVDLQLSHWCIAGERTDVIERLAAQHAIFATRLETTVATEIGRADRDVDPNLLASWIGEAQISLVLKAVLGALRRGATPDAALRNTVAAYLRDQPVIGDPAGGPPAALLELLDPVTRQPPLLYDAIEIDPDASSSDIARAAEAAVERATAAVAQARSRGDQRRLAVSLAQLARVSQARDTLQDPAKRAAYDSGCMSHAEHGYNKARYQFILDLAKHVSALMRKDKHDLVRLLARAYRQLPHDRIDGYFDPEERGAIRDHMIASATRLAHLRELMDRESHEAAHATAEQALGFLESWRSLPGDAAPHVFYYLALCEFYRELAHVRMNGVFTAPGVAVTTLAAKRLEELGMPDEGDEEDA